MNRFCLTICITSFFFISSLLGIGVNAETRLGQNLESKLKPIEGPQSFNDWKNSIRYKASIQGVSYNTLASALNELTPDPKVLALDSSQPEFTKSIWSYVDNATSKSRLKKGQKLLKKHTVILSEIEQRYGVPKEIIVAIWAMESDFGANYGSKNVIRSLATLAYQGKRAEFAEQELIAALHIVQNRYASKKEMVGSWAGAIGQAQFMPSSYLKYAIDHNADGKRDLWKTLPDVFASIANFLIQSGWRTNQDWGTEVAIPNDFDWRLNAAGYELQFSQWERIGIRLKLRSKRLRLIGSGFPNSHRHASLFIPAGKNGPAFLITHNFNVIRRYNKSSSYALAVAQLSRLLKNTSTDTGKIIASWPREDKPLTHLQKEEIQVMLGLAGFDSGKIDGKIGENTRNAIKAWQIKQGLIGDGYANMALLERLRNHDSERTKANK